MKSMFRTALLAALAVAALGVTALAADTGGMYNVTKEAGYEDAVTLTPQTADGTGITGSSDTELGGTFYAGAEKLQVTYTGAAGTQYLVLALDKVGNVAPTEDNIVYIDQRAADSTGVTFTVYPSSLVSGKTYGIYLSSSDGMSLTRVGSFDYYMPYTLGDVDSDGYWTANDALYALQIAVNRTTIRIAGVDVEVTETIRASADVDIDGFVTANDALKILQKAVGRDVF